VTSGAYAGSIRRLTLSRKLSPRTRGIALVQSFAGTVQKTLPFRVTSDGYLADDLEKGDAVLEWLRELTLGQLED
jgi:hypothetical protein